jgi:5-formyltetrahydrofolate cyclo-ligase
MSLYFTPDPGGRSAKAQKAAWREVLTHRRQVIPADLHNTTTWKVYNNLRAILAELPTSVVALYIPRAGEVDVLPLAADLRAAGHTIALPRVGYASHGYVFNVWTEAEQTAAQFDTDDRSMPVASGPEVIPAVIVCPMLGYTRTGYRLGYGGGYYNLTLKTLPYTPLSIGVCHTELEVHHFPVEYADIRLNYVITGKEIICI